jgi:hypothetical protein
MRPKPKAKLYNVVLVYANDMTRTVVVKATTREVAENRALKRNPAATGVKR